jgi:RimJ/RimL family protein N-acetyltransferase
LKESPSVFTDIVTERLILRRLRQSDAEPLFLYRSDSGVATYQDWQPGSMDETRQFIDTCARVDIDTPDTWFQLALVHRARGTLIGDCGLHFLSSDPLQVEIGITLAASHHRQGFGSEAVMAILEFVFAKLGKHRVFASVDPRNTAAIALFNRVGMRKEAHFIESLWLNEEWVDEVIFAMLEREWKLGSTSETATRI